MTELQRLLKQMERDRRMSDLLQRVATVALIVFVLGGAAAALALVLGALPCP